jgi:hypothetical protein
MKLNEACPTMPPFLELASPRAIDGDTIEANIVLPLGITHRRRIRLMGFFATEHHGQTPEVAAAAQKRLQGWLDGHECHLQTTGMREDRYGRLCARLWLDRRLVDPAIVLGPYQMTEQDHQRELKLARKVGGRKRATEKEKEGQWQDDIAENRPAGAPSVKRNAPWNEGAL